VFSFDVIDHVYDVDLFLSKVISVCSKYGYISAFRGFFPQLKIHKQEWRDDQGIFYNDLSVKQLEDTLLHCGLSKEEFKIRSKGVRDKLLYDSDLGRAYKRADEVGKEELITLTGYDAEILNKLPTGLELETHVVDSIKDSKLTPEKLGLSASLKDAINHKHTVIEIIKKPETR
jgi:hypothetical protein